MGATMIKNLQDNAARVGQPNSPYWERLKLDKHGLYAECQKVEAAAKERPAISANHLPGTDILCRSWKPPPLHRSDHGNRCQAASHRHQIINWFIALLCDA